MQGVTQSGQVFFHHHRAHAQPGRGLAGKTGDFRRVAVHEIGLIWRQGVECRLDLLRGLHQLRFLIGAGGVVRVAQYDQRTGLDIASRRIERSKLAHHGGIGRGEQRGLQGFAGHAFGHHIEARFLRFRAGEYRRRRWVRRGETRLTWRGRLTGGSTGNGLRGAPDRSRCRIGAAIGRRDHRGDQPGLAGAIAVAVQRARHGFAMTDHVGNATDDLVSLAVLATGDPITFAGMGDAVHHDAGMTIQDFAATGGLVMQANEISFVH
ncbi:hypothetical protein D3C87_1275960 [compost metagenome]